MKFINTMTRVALLFICIMFISKTVRSQLYNNGADIVLTSGSLVYSAGTITNTAGGAISNAGNLMSDADIINDAGASLSGDGTYSVQRDFRNTGTFTQGNSILYFYGDLNSTLKNASGNIANLQINKGINYYVSLIDDQTIFKTVNFGSDKNFIKLNDRNLTLGASCTISGFSNKRYFVTNGNGSVKKVNISTGGFTFPVGFDRLTYNPLIITENGTADNYSVRCLQRAKLNGGTGDTISTDGIDVSWFVTEQTAGGANAVIQAQWKKYDDELTGFDYTNCEVVRYTNSGWNYNSSLAGVATQANGYRSIARSGFVSFGYFTVLSSANPTFANNPITNNALAANSNFKIYPTIVQNNININVPPFKNIQKMNITVMDADGKTVWQKQNADFASQKITLPNLAAGAYIVSIDYNGNSFVQKIIVSK